MTRLTPEQQVEVLWKALQDSRSWVSVDTIGQLVLSAVTSSAKPNAVGPIKHVFSGSRDTCIEQLHALQVVDRLDGYVEPGSGPTSDPWADKARV